MEGLAAVKWPSVSLDEFKTFHRYDRLLFAVLVYKHGRQTNEAMTVVAFWMWMEQRFGDLNLIYKILKMTATHLKELVDETIRCFWCVDSAEFRLPGSDELFHVRNLMNGMVCTYRDLHNVRADVIKGVHVMVEQTCHKLFADIIQKVLAKATRGGDVASTSQQPPRPLSPPPIPVSANDVIEFPEVGVFFVPPPAPVSVPKADDIIRLPEVDVFLVPPPAPVPVLEADDVIHFPEVDVFFEPPTPPPPPRSTLPASARPFIPAAASSSVNRLTAPPLIPTVGTTSTLPHTAAPALIPVAASSSFQALTATLPHTQRQFIPTALSASTLPYTAPPFTPAAASTSVLPHTAPPFTPAAASTSLMPYTAQPYIVPAAATSVLPHTAQPFLPETRGSHLPELIRCGFGPPSSENGILGSAPGNGGGYEANMAAANSNAAELMRAEAFNRAVEQMLLLGSELGRQQQAAAAMGYQAMGMPFPVGPNTVMGHPVAQWVPVNIVPVPVADYAPAVHHQQMMMGHGGNVVAPPPEPVFLPDDVISRFLEMEACDADSRTIFVTFSKGYPIPEGEVYEFFTRKFGDIVESIQMQPVQGNEQALFAKLVARSQAAVDLVVQGGRAKYVINGKHVVVRKFIKKGPASAAASDVAGPSNA